MTILQSHWQKVIRYFRRRTNKSVVCAGLYEGQACPLPRERCKSWARKRSQERRFSFCVLFKPGTRIGYTSHSLRVLMKKPPGWISSNRLLARVHFSLRKREVLR